MSRYSITPYYIKNMLKIWALVPLNDKACDYIWYMCKSYLLNIDHPKIIELWPWTGNITQKIIQALPHAEIVSIEIDPKLANICKSKFQNVKNLKIIQDNALNIDDYINDWSVDIVISTIPFTFLGDDLTVLLKKISNKLVRWWHLIIWQISKRQNKVIKNYIGKMKSIEVISDIHPIIVTSWENEQIFSYKTFTKTENRALHSKFKRIWELICWIKLAKDTVPRIKQLNKIKIPCSISYLPIESYTEEEAEKTCKEYIHLIDTLKSDWVSEWMNDVTIKLYQLGQYKFPALCEILLKKIINHADKSWIFIWIDTSDRAHYNGTNIVDQTIEVFHKAQKHIKSEYKEVGVGICLQAYLTRTRTDLETLISQWYIVRLVKWFYNEYDIANWADVTNNFLKLVKLALLNKNLNFLAIATHDKWLIKEILAFVKEQKIEFNKFSIQWFWGVKTQMYLDLKDQWINVKIYIPYWNFLKFLTRGITHMDIIRIVQRLFHIKTIR